MSGEFQMHIGERRSRRPSKLDGQSQIQGRDGFSGGTRDNKGQRARSSAVSPAISHPTQAPNPAFVGASVRCEAANRRPGPTVLLNPRQTPTVPERQRRQCCRSWFHRLGREHGKGTERCWSLAFDKRCAASSSPAAPEPRRRGLPRARRREAPWTH